ncbi:hypothetical protein BJV78DRAFT_1265470 [Lactifluus subvellereus]|nr:hypothetical protein BJV78DRAFT_1265470 [Lactifluus subvellereus]
MDEKTMASLSTTVTKTGHVDSCIFYIRTPYGGLVHTPHSFYEAANSDGCNLLSWPSSNIGSPTRHLFSWRCRLLIPHPYLEGHSHAPSPYSDFEAQRERLAHGRLAPRGARKRTSSRGKQMYWEFVEAHRNPKCLGEAPCIRRSLLAIMKASYLNMFLILIPISWYSISITRMS